MKIRLLKTRPRGVLANYLLDTRFHFIFHR